MNYQDRITQLKTHLLEGVPPGADKLAALRIFLGALDKSQTEEDFDRALADIETFYDAEKMNYRHVQRRMISEAISELKGSQALSKAKKAIAKTSSTVWKGGLLPAANHTVIPAAAAVQGFFKGLFGK